MEPWIDFSHCAGDGNGKMNESDVQKPLEKVRHFLHLDKMPDKPRKVLVCIVGGLFLLAGAAMVVLPGPALVFIPLGLLLMASEFEWAQQAVHKVFAGFSKLRKKWQQKRA